MATNIIIIGGGASGLVAAISAARAGSKVTILEHKDKVGKKILATGNGKCNYTNYVQEPACYRGQNPKFALPILKQFDEKKTIEFFRELGIYPKVRNGYVYPNSAQASSVVDVLELEAQGLGVRIICNQHVEHIKKQKKNFLVETTTDKFYGDRVIVTTGGCASKNHGSDGSGFILAKELGHHIVKPLPALVQLKSNAKYLKTLTGVRVDAFIKLFVNGKEVTRETGEILFANYGISGIPVMQVSRYAAVGLEAKQAVQLEIDFLPDLSEEEVIAMLEQRFLNCKQKTVEEVFLGLFNHKLTYILLKEAGIDPVMSAKGMKREWIRKIAKQIKSFTMKITDTNGFDNAQTSAGGVDTREINGETLESSITQGIYFAGEVIDIDGTCGGYNLQWAWSSGYIAGINASKS